MPSPTAGYFFLVGHSWRSVLGAELAQRYPQDYLAYLGVGQVVNVAEGELLGRGEILARALTTGDMATVQAVESNRRCGGGDRPIRSQDTIPCHMLICLDPLTG